jgi:LuxR family maltose regulon positive regulatory protein
MLTLQRLRVRGEVAELRQDALALDAAEIDDLVREIGSVSLAEDQIARVVSRTEGWVAGVQLAALSMRDATDVDQFVDYFAGDDRAIADYLTGEILAHQPPEVRRFLLRTAVLERLTAPLCDALTGDSDGQRMLDELERRGLFLSPLDNRRRWFRYHRLFRDVLRYNLVAEDRDLERILLHRAANWHLAEGHLDDAIGYLIEARAWDQIIDLVLHHGRAMWERGDATVALRWLDAVPERSLSPRASVRLARAALNVMVGRMLTADEILGELEANPTLTPGEQMYVDMLRAAMVQYGLAPSRVIDAADRVLAALGTPAAAEVPDIMGLGLPARAEIAAVASKGRALFYDGDTAGARQWVARALDCACTA